MWTNCLQMGLKVRKVVCEPSKSEAVVIPNQNKGGVLMQTYYKGYSNFWTGRQYVLEYEEIGGDIPGRVL